MTIHYHGTPISPRSVLYTLAGRHFCVSFAAPQDVTICHQIGQSVMLDNGAFSVWRAGRTVEWSAYYQWAEPWLDYQTTWAVVPDVIDAGPEAQDELLRQWPHGHRGAPVWHTDEPVDRLLRLADDWPRVCIGSSGQHEPGSEAWHRVMDAAMNRMCRSGRSTTWLHMLRGMNLCDSGYPFASVDSTDIARNHNRGRPARTMADRWDALQAPGRWVRRTEQVDLWEMADAG